MNLPVEAGVVAAEGPKSLHVAYVDGSAKDGPDGRFRAWGHALERAGWHTRGDAYGLAHLRAMDFARDQAQLTLMVSKAGSRVDVQVEMD